MLNIFKSYDIDDGSISDANSQILDFCNVRIGYYKRRALNSFLADYCFKMLFVPACLR